MTDRELMQESLIALRSCSGAPHWPALQPIVTALRERLARLDFEMQPCAGRNCGSTNPNLHSAECFEDYEKSTGMATQPVAWQWKERINGDFDSWVISASEPPPYATEKHPLYTAPPKREWVGLTDDEICKCAGIDGGDTWIFETAYAITAKLKEKNA